MIPNNNLSVLPWYRTIGEQNARRWWLYGKIYPLFTPAGFVLPFQILRSYAIVTNFQCELYDASGQLIDSTIGQKMLDTGLQFKRVNNYTIAVYPGNLPLFTSIDNGRYYFRCRINELFFYSEIFTVVNDIEPYLKITWWDISDFVMDSGAIVYKEPNFKNIMYLNSDIAKPEYSFEEEGEIRDGYFFPIKQISEKRYRFNFLASEYMLDVMRFIRMADFAEIEYHGQKYSLDTFLITPEWQDNGDVAVVEAVFDTATVAKKVGTGYIKAQRGDFNDDFNNDFNN